MDIHSFRPRNVAFVAVIASLVAACNSDKTATSPTPASPAAGTTFTVSGAVIEHLWGRNPQRPPGVSIQIGTDRSGTFSGRSDANGRYSISGVPADNIWVEARADSGYRSPCPFGGKLGADAVVDVHMINAAVLSSEGPPPTWPRTNLPFTGTVFEMVGGTRQALPGAAVQFPGQVGTLTDSTGEFVVCTVPPGRGGNEMDMTLNFFKDGFATAARTVNALTEARVEVQLTRR